ncbi:MAG: Gfo/Idh/MocA family oxidoreductase [Pirellulaceae bacterium]
MQEKSHSHLGVTRRSFLDQTAGTLGAAAVALTSASVHQSQAAEDNPAKVRVAVMGVNDRGRSLVKRFLAFPQVEVAYLCDPDAAVIPQVAQNVVEQSGKSPKVVKDFRVALDDPSIDALVCAAPDHWHALATILACQAGKDVYVEKPASLTLAEGRLMVQAARRYQRVVQTGTQRRSAADFKAAVELVRSGRMGKVYMAHARQSKGRPDIGKQSVVAPPPSLDFDLWCGPAPNNGYKKNLVHYNWHWRWDYGSGDCGNLGVHALDVVRWVMDLEYPRTVSAGGGNFAFDDDMETPDTQSATFDFDNASVLWDNRMWAEATPANWITFYGTEGRLECGEFGWNLYRGDQVIESHAALTYTLADLAHVENFLECIATRQQPNADIEIGHRSAALAHLANIAYRTRSTLQFDQHTESIVGNAPANELLRRNYRTDFDGSQVLASNASP